MWFTLPSPRQDGTGKSELIITGIRPREGRGGEGRKAGAWPSNIVVVLMHRCLHARGRPWKFAGRQKGFFAGGTGQSRVGGGCGGRAGHSLKCLRSGGTNPFESGRTLYKTHLSYVVTSFAIVLQINRGGCRKFFTIILYFITVPAGGFPPFSQVAKFEPVTCERSGRGCQRRRACCQKVVPHGPRRPQKRNIENLYFIETE